MQANVEATKQIANWRKDIKRAIATGDMIRANKQLTVDVDSLDDGELGPREIRFVASTGVEDRDGDVIEPDGIKLENFRANRGPFLYFHRQSEEPIAKVNRSKIVAGKMIADVEFMDPEELGFYDQMIERANRVFLLYKHGFMNAVSIGFVAKPGDVEERDNGGFRFKSIEVLELSAVSVPSNPQALQTDAIENAQRETEGASKSTQTNTEVVMADGRGDAPQLQQETIEAALRAVYGESLNAPLVEPDEQKRGRTLRKDVARKVAKIRRIADDLMGEEGMDVGVPHEDEIDSVHTDEDPDDKSVELHPESVPSGDIVHREMTPDVQEQVVAILNAKANRADRMVELVEGPDRFNVGSGKEFMQLLKNDMRANKALVEILGLNDDKAVEGDEPQEPQSSGADTEDDSYKSPEKGQKGVTEFLDLPLAARDREWDSAAADERWRNETDSTDEPGQDYWRNFVWFDEEAPGEFGSYKLPYGDIIEGDHAAVPRGVFAAAGAIQGARTEVAIPEDDIDAAKSHLEQYYEKMRSTFDDESIIAPWVGEESVSEYIENQFENFGFESLESAKKFMVEQLEFFGVNGAKTIVGFDDPEVNETPETKTLDDIVVEVNWGETDPDRRLVNQ